MTVLLLPSVVGVAFDVCDSLPMDTTYWWRQMVVTQIPTITYIKKTILCHVPSAYDMLHKYKFNDRLSLVNCPSTPINHTISSIVA